MDRYAYTSDNVCNLVAKRTVREHRDGCMDAFAIAAEALVPLADDYVTRGKIRRDRLRPMVRGIIEGLRNHPSVPYLSVRVEGSALSGTETFHINMITTFSLKGFAGWLDFSACRVTITRHYAEMDILGSEFRVSEHVLSRYMAREQRPVATFFHDIIRPMRAALPLGGNIAFKDHREIAVPFSTGLLLGRVLVEEMTGNTTNMELRLDKNGRDTRQNTRNRSLLGSHRCFFEMLTFIDGDSLNASKTALHRSLLQFEAKHDAALASMFDRLVFDLPAKTLHRPVIEDGHALVNSPVWDAVFANRAAKLVAAQ